MARAKRIINPGDKYQNWTIVREVEPESYIWEGNEKHPPSTVTMRKFEAQCKCGTLRVVRINNLISKASKGCGCEAKPRWDANRKRHTAGKGDWKANGNSGSRA